MNRMVVGSRTSLVAGLAGMLVGAIDPLEGSPVILLGAALAALGAALAKSRSRQLSYWALALATLGIGAMFVLSALGGIGGAAELSIWWGVVVLPYPVGWILGLVGAVAALVESFRPRRAGHAANQ